MLADRSNSVSMKRAAQAVESLPSLPVAVLRVVRMANKPDPNITEIAAAAQADQGLSSRMLRTANSAFYGLPRQISTIYEASALLGTSTVRNLAMFAAACTWFTTAKPSIRGWMNELLLSSIANAICSQLIAEKAMKRMSDDAFCAGLLQNIGAAAMILWRESKYEVVLKAADLRRSPVYRVEQELFSFDHCLLGGMIGEQWNLPPQMLEVVRCHHNPDAAEVNPTLTRIVYISDHLCRVARLSPSWDRHLDPSVDVSTLGLDEPACENIIARLHELYEQSKSFAMAA